MISRIVRTTELVLPSHANIRRLPPRPPELQQGDYLELFDSQTVWCDVFRSGPRLTMVGPPLLNLRDRFLDAEYKFDGQLVSERPSSYPLNRAETMVLRVRADLNPLLRDKTVLVGMQRNNELAWIVDWVTFYVTVNRVNAVVIYDLMSTRTTADQVLAALEAIEGLDAALIVEWPYKYGAQPSGPNQTWDSDYGQYVAWEHCRRRLLQETYAVTIADLDELFLAEDGRSIFDHAADNECGVVRFKQRFIEAAVERAPTAGKERSYDGYYFYDGSAPLSTPKWAAITDRLGEVNQLLVHTVDKIYEPYSDAVIGRQFKAMKLAWQRKSFERKHPDYLVETNSSLEQDEVLQEAYRMVASRKG